MSYQRAKVFDSGRAMVVTDLHGDGEIYSIIKERFLVMRAAGEVERLVICGDLIHGYGELQDDYSIAMLLDLMALQAELGDDTVVLLMGNHEMPHIYNITLTKGNREFTARFEQALSASGRRDEVMQFLMNLPFFVFTQAGVLLSHAGASPAVSSPEHAEHILTFDHEAVLQLAEDRLQNGYDLARLRTDTNYLQQATHFTAIESAGDHRIHHLLRGQVISQTDDNFSFLWDILFSRNEQEVGLVGYQAIVQYFLRALSACAPYEQRVLVAGHIGTRGGHAMIGQHHLRLSSYAHAHPQEDGEYLILDCAKPVRTVDELIPHLYHTLDD